MEKILKLVHYKQIVLDKIATVNNNPNNRHIVEWTDTHIRPNRLIHTMEAEGLIKIEMVHDGKTVRRMLIPLVKKISIDEMYT